MNVSSSRKVTGWIASFLKTAVLKYKLPTIQFTVLKCTVQFCLENSQLCNHHHNQHEKLLITSKRNFITFSSPFPFLTNSLSFRQPLTLSLYGQIVVFMSSSFMFSRFIRIIAGISISSFLLPNNIPIKWIYGPHFICKFTSGRYLDFYTIFDYYE